MTLLERNSIRLNASARNKADAIRQVGTLLVDAGQMKPDYITSMLNREQVANTYLGNGIAIPHGLPENRDLILETGIAVLQLPAGVEWNPGETVHLVVGIAAKSDEHIGILANLTHVLGDEAAVQQLATTQDATVILQRLTDRAEAERQENSTDLTQGVDVQGVDVVIQDPTGLHARPATALVSVAKRFNAEIRVRYGNRTANAKSLISLLKLGVAGGETIHLTAEGDDAAEALSSLKAAIAVGLEGETPIEAVGQSSVRFVTQPISGIAASPGLAIAPIYLFKRGKIVVDSSAPESAPESASESSPESSPDSDAEALRLQQAIATAQLQLQQVYESVKARAGAAQAAIFQAHQEFLDDPELQQEARARLAGHSAAWAWQQTYEQRADALAKLDNPLLAERATDLRDVGQRVLKLLAETGEAAPQLPDQPVILVAEDLTPSDTAGLDPALILGFCTASGGPTSHSAIIARALGIPAIVGAGPAVLNLTAGELCILDGSSGNLYPRPSDADLALAQTAEQDLAAVRQAEQLACYQPALMKDGHRVEVVANIGAAAEAQQAVEAGAEGVGLLRTEFLFLNRAEPPSEAEQFSAYSQMTAALNGLPLIVRTLDIGGDKAIPYLKLPAEANPFLGLRGIRLCLHYPDLFKTQLRAIFRAAQTGPVKIMFPMIATLEEFEAARQIAEAVRAELGAEPVDYGMMVEVPSAVLLAREFARQVAFFSIGTNDLTQYALAMDRGHPALAQQADGLHPAVLRLIDQTVRAAKAEGKWVGVCGGIAAEPLGAAILTGLGVTELSVSIPSIAAVKAKLRSLSFSEVEAIAQRALHCPSAPAVRSLA